MLKQTFVYTMINPQPFKEIIIAGLKATMKVKNRNATGRSIASVYGQYDEANKILYILGASQWKEIETGTPAGTYIPYDRLLEWVVAKGIPQKATAAIQKSIYVNGAPKDKTKLNVVADTMKNVEKDLAKELERQAGLEIQKLIGPQWQSL